MKTTNNYDLHALARAKEFASGTNLVHAYIEKPAMYKLLPELEGKTVLCVGCGTGEECAELSAKGAKVFGVDISGTSITYAAKQVPDVDFRVVDMDSPALSGAFKEKQFDLIYSSLTLHYSNDLPALLKSLGSMLKPGGYLLFSVGHPLRWAADVKLDRDSKSVVMGYRQQNGELEVFGDYLSTKQFTQQLADGPEVTYWMRPISAYFTLLKEADFTVLEFNEPTPLVEVKKVDMSFWHLRSKMPVDMVFLAQKL